MQKGYIAVIKDRMLPPLNTATIKRAEKEAILNTTKYTVKERSEMRLVDISISRFRICSSKVLRISS